MAESFKKVNAKLLPRLKGKLTADNLYWDNLQFPITRKEYFPATHIEFNQSHPHQYAITCSSKVHVYNCRNDAHLRNLTKSKDTAYCGSFRPDGTLIVAGGEETRIRVYDFKENMMLRTLDGHERSVHLTKFMSEGNRIFSGSDDCTVRLWDMAVSTQLQLYAESKDYVRCGAAWAQGNDLFMTGSYDHSVRLFDTRVSHSILTVNHEHPVESVLMFPTGGIFLTAGGNVVKVWDALAGGKLLTTLENHHKTVTSLGLCYGNKRFFSAALDRHMNIYDVSTFGVVHTLTYPGAILSAAISPDDHTVIVGTVDGLVSIRHRKESSSEGELTTEKTNYRLRVSGKTHLTQKQRPSETRLKLQHGPIETRLRSFQHSAALDEALKTKVGTEETLAVIQELMRRNRLHSAMAGRNATTIAPLIRFIQQNISNPLYMPVLIDTANVLLDIYGKEDLISTKHVYRLITNLKITLDSEVMYMKKLMTMVGMMDTILAANSANT